jgi:homocysteine S-methyltransferase
MNQDGASGGTEQSSTGNVDPLHQLLDTQGFIVLDGALATELERRGADLRDPLWSAKLLVEAPEAIRQLHYDYLCAGADVVITASYQATLEGFAARGIGRRDALHLLQRSVTLAMEAREQFWAEPAKRQGRLRPLVAASVGPYGAYLADGSEYRGDYGQKMTELMDFHRERMAVLWEAGPDLLACETVPSQVEGEALIRLLAERQEMRAWLSFSCCDDRHVCHGEPFVDCVLMAAACPQILATGLNCTPPQFAPSLLAGARSKTTLPLVAYPNRGEGWDSQTGCWLPDGGIEDFAGSAAALAKAGARLIGGCCRTTPDDIARLRMRLQEAHLGGGAA